MMDTLTPGIPAPATPILAKLHAEGYTHDAIRYARKRLHITTYAGAEGQMWLLHPSMNATRPDERPSVNNSQ
jgi:hypothetical protein